MVDLHRNCFESAFWNARYAAVALKTDVFLNATLFLPYRIITESCSDVNIYCVANRSHCELYFRAEGIMR